MGYFWGLGRVQKLFRSVLLYTNNFCFVSIAVFLLSHALYIFSSLASSGGQPGEWVDEFNAATGPN